MKLEASKFNYVSFAFVMLFSVILMFKAALPFGLSPENALESVQKPSYQELSFNLMIFSFLFVLGGVLIAKMKADGSPKLNAGILFSVGLVFVVLYAFFSEEGLKHRWWQVPPLVVPCLFVLMIAIASSIKTRNDTYRAMTMFITAFLASLGLYFIGAIKDYNNVTHIVILVTTAFLYTIESEKIKIN